MPKSLRYTVQLPYNSWFVHVKYHFFHYFQQSGTRILLKINVAY